MNQQQFKEAIFESKEKIKNKFAGVYNSKRLKKLFITIFGKMDYLTYSKLPENEKQELVEKLFGSPELLFGKIFREEIEKGYKIGNKRQKSKQEKE